jgi:hypothetical protein
MIPHTNGNGTRPGNRVVPITSSKGKSSARQNNAAEISAQAADASTPEPQPSVKTKQAEELSSTIGSEGPALSKRILETFQDDADPVKSLADIRRLLIGPVSRLHEARMEEFVTILEEADQANRQSAKSLHERCDNLVETCEHIISEFVKNNDAFQAQSAQNRVELQRATETLNQTINDMGMLFDSKLQKLSAEMNHRFDAMASKTSSDYQALSKNLAAQINGLAESTTANDERIATNLEAQLANSEANAHVLRSQDFDNLADGFADFAQRIMTMRGGKSK